LWGSARGGKLVRARRYDKVKRIGGKGGLRGDENHGFELETELQWWRL
jgi:hypothetical protein